MSRSLVLLLLLVGCGSSDPAPAPAADAAPDAPADVAETGPVNKCATVKCDASTVCDPLDGVCKPIRNPSIGASCGGETGPGCSGAGATCLTDKMPDGYCITAPCSLDAPCPLGSTCAKLHGKQGCFKQCAIDGECRGGVEYKCQDVGSLYVGGGTRKVCYLPAFPCEIDDDCPKPQVCGAEKLCKAP